MSGFPFRWETVEGESAEPPTLSAAVSELARYSTMHVLGRTLRVVGTPLTTVEESP